MTNSKYSSMNTKTDVDQALADSFPASDPPAWTPGEADTGSEATRQPHQAANANGPELTPTEVRQGNKTGRVLAVLIASSLAAIAFLYFAWAAVAS